MRLVLDTNCLIQVIPSRSRYHSVWQSFERGENTLCVSYRGQVKQSPIK